MGFPEALAVGYLLLWLIAVTDAAISKFTRVYYGFVWLLVIFIVPFANIAYLLFGTRQVVSGGLRLLHRREKESSL